MATALFNFGLNVGKGLLGLAAGVSATTVGAAVATVAAPFVAKDVYDFFTKGTDHRTIGERSLSILSGNSDFFVSETGLRSDGSRTLLAQIGSPVETITSWFSPASTTTTVTISQNVDIQLSAKQIREDFYKQQIDAYNKFFNTSLGKEYLESMGLGNDINKVAAAIMALYEAGELPASIMQIGSGADDDDVSWDIPEIPDAEADPGEIIANLQRQLSEAQDRENNLQEQCDTLSGQCRNNRNLGILAAVFMLLIGGAGTYTGLTFGRNNPTSEAVTSSREFQQLEYGLYDSRLLASIQTARLTVSFINGDSPSAEVAQKLSALNDRVQILRELKNSSNPDISQIASSLEKEYALLVQILKLHNLEKISVGVKPGELRFTQLTSFMSSSSESLLPTDGETIESAKAKIAELEADLLPLEMPKP